MTMRGGDDFRAVNEAKQNAHIAWTMNVIAHLVGLVEENRNEECAAIIRNMPEADVKQAFALTLRLFAQSHEFIHDIISKLTGGIVIDVTEVLQQMAKEMNEKGGDDEGPRRETP